MAIKDIFIPCAAGCVTSGVCKGKKKSLPFFKGRKLQIKMASVGIVQKEEKTTFCSGILQLSKEHFVSLFCSWSFN